MGVSFRNDLMLKILHNVKLNLTRLNKIKINSKIRFVMTKSKCWN